jgi:hypothetical protein
MRSDWRRIGTRRYAGVTEEPLASTAGGGWLHSPPKGGEERAVTAPKRA